jgi:L-alanine-DL-glutamate epimerase-like enolase superfamily enzyme
MDIQGAWTAMVHSIRNLGRPGISSMAIAAVDNSLWDLKARLLALPLVKLIGVERSSVLAYGSGGFTSYSEKQLCEQLGNWGSHGFKAVKMKIGRRPEEDVARVRAARRAVGSRIQLFLDANGSYSQTQAHHFAEKFAEPGVNWFEEPVSSDDLKGLRFVRDHAPAGMDIAAGEYGYDLIYFQRMLDAGAVHVLQADASRCAGITEFLRVGALCDALLIPLSAHTAPSLHLHPCCAVPAVRHIEYFHDHERIEHMLFDGASTPIRGTLSPDLTRPGIGLELKQKDAAKYAA